jgi:diguanylate cyclase (GGDEF)-like protein/PAS domain S-box-containing protein
MLNLLEVEDYSELINFFRDLAVQMKENKENSLHFNQIVDHIEDTLEAFSRLKYAIDQSIIVAATNVNGQILYANDKFCEISQYSREELIGKTHRMINSGYHDKSFFNDMWDTIKKGRVWEGNVKNKAKDGSYYWVKSTIVPFCNENNEPYMFVALRTDITKGKENEEKLVVALKNDFNLVVSTMHNFVFKLTKNEAGQFIYLFGEGKLAHQLGLDTSNINQKCPEDIFSDEVADFLGSKYRQSYMGQTITYDYSFNGRHILTTLSPIYSNNQIESLIGCTNDITELHTAKQEVEFLAFHDPLTKLPNRRKFIEDITKLIHEGKRFSLLFLDLDRFKLINDSLGHTYGDDLLKVVTDRMYKFIGPNDYFYRFASDEFIILLPGHINEIELENYACHLQAVLKDKIKLRNTIEVYITGSIGISIFPDHGGDMDTLLKNADSAMYTAKKAGKNFYKIYDQSMKNANQKYLEMETCLKTAIENDELKLFYQPKLAIKENRINSMEALLRWQNPILGSVPPDTFIPLAEETGIIWEIDEWVLKNACIQNKKWNKSEMIDPLRVAVNISALQFSHPNFVEMVIRILKETELPSELLELEITETTIIENTEECINNVKKLRDIGIIVSIDDFGTGYTSLNYLKRFPFDCLKIDQTYVKELLKNKEDMAIVKTIIALAHELQLKVIAEGVEDKEILDCLIQMGCDEIQGYFVSRPLPELEFETMIRWQHKNQVILS